MSDSVRPHRRQPTRLPRSWDSPGENTGVGCHFLLQCMKVKGEIEVSRSCPTLSDPMDRSPPGSSVHAIFQARALERVAIASPLTVCRTLQNLTPTSQRPRAPSSSCSFQCCISPLNHCTCASTAVVFPSFVA